MTRPQQEVLEADRATVNAALDRIGQERQRRPYLVGDRGSKHA